MGFNLNFSLFSKNNKFIINVDYNFFTIINTIQVLIKCKSQDVVILVNRLAQKQ